MRTVQDLSSCTSIAKVFSTLDSTSGFWQIKGDWVLPYFTLQQPIWKVKVSPDALWNHLWIWLLSAHDGIVVCWVSLFAGFPCSTIVDNLLVLLLERNQLQWWFERWRLYIMKKRSFHSTIAANGVLSDFPNVKAIRREERNCLKHLINGKAPFATLPTGFGKCLIL